jgi:hypothetical protein
MQTFIFSRLWRIKINPIRKGKSRFLLRLEFHGIETPDAIEFEGGPTDLAALLAALQRYQATHNIPTQSIRRLHGKPRLRVVKDDD